MFHNYHLDCIQETVTIFFIGCYFIGQCNNKINCINIAGISINMWSIRKFEFN